MKLSLLDGRLDLNGSVFHYVYDNYQAFSNNDGNFIIRNLPAEMTGVEGRVQCAADGCA